MRDFLCQFCPQRFGRKDHLVRHIKKSHSKNLPPEQQPKGGEREPVEMVVVKTEYPETSVKIETTSESSVSNPEPFNPLEFNIETFSETDLIFGQVRMILLHIIYLCIVGYCSPAYDTRTATISPFDVHATATGYVS